MVRKTAKVLFLVLVEIVLVKLFVIAVLLISSWSERVIPWLGGHSDKPKLEASKSRKKNSTPCIKKNPKRKHKR